MKPLKSTIFTLCLGLSVLTSTQLYAKDSYKIGLAGPMTGTAANYGAQMRLGAELAVKNINAAGGINGKPIVLVIGDDACEPKQAIALASRLVEQDKVDAIAGHFCSSSTLPASETYNEANILMVTPGSTHPLVTDRNLASVVRIIGRDDQQGMVAANYIKNVLHAQKIAIIHDKDTYGKGIADATRDQLHKYGIKEVVYEGLTRGEKDFNALVTKIKASGADLVYFGGLSAEAGTLLRQLREQGVQANFMGVDGIVDDTFRTAAGSPAVTKGVLMTIGEDPRELPSAKAVVATYRAEGKEPEGHTLYSYAAIQVISAAIASTQSTQGDVLAKWLKNNRVETVLGSKSWDPKGDLTEAGYRVYQWQADGSYHVVN